MFSVDVLKNDNKNKSASLAKLPQMAKQLQQMAQLLEAILYGQAPSFADCADMYTFKPRVQAAAEWIISRRRNDADTVTNAIADSDTDTNSNTDTNTDTETDT